MKIRPVLFLLFFLLPAPAFSHADSARLRTHVATITRDFGNRDYTRPETLDSVAAYITSQLRPYADTVYDQVYEAEGRTYRNVIASFGDTSLPVVVIGAHYDVCGQQEGADDNASGVAGLLELARLLDTAKPGRRIELVAYSLEEPPFFRTVHMGSYVHAESLKKRNARVEAMISLEMIGYFRDEKKSQHYPVSVLKLIYGSRGNFITLVSKPSPGKFCRTFSREFKRSHAIRTKKFRAPAAIPGIDFSDHLNYWHFGYRAMMITDTAFFRNLSYHETGDQLEALDFARMAKVVDGVYAALQAM